MSLNPVSKPTDAIKLGVRNPITAKFLEFQTIGRTEHISPDEDSGR